ncbi:DUF4333 domain-containing protein [Pseudonocardia phyllosphaerae]|uniref:DUF4333 domain-containing protein n=1 Tax=Pseudonocardia phyllosphaerae TaxID=3390502 RepID=UPI00397A9858
MTDRHPDHDDAPRGWAGQGARDAGWDPDTARHDPARDSGWAPPGQHGTDPDAGWTQEDQRDWERAGGGHGSWEEQSSWGEQDTWGRHDDPAATGRQDSVWGDGSDTGGWGVPVGGHRGAQQQTGAFEPPTDAIPESSPSSGWGAAPAAGDGDGPAGGHGYRQDGPGTDEPWAPQDNVRTPKKGPFGLGMAVWAAIAAAAVILAVVLITAFVAPGWALKPKLDRTALQNGVTKVLREDYKLGVGAIQCPGDVAAEPGTEFSCQAVVDGEQLEVPGVVTTDKGDYQIKRV